MCNLVVVGEVIEFEFGILIINKWIFVILIVIIVGLSVDIDYVEFVKIFDVVVKEVGVNFIGGYFVFV